MKSILLLLLSVGMACAQLTVMVSPPKVTGEKAVVSLEMRNNLTESIESARAVCFLTGEHGRAIGQPTTRWVIGGSSAGGLAPGATNTFHFVVTADQPFTTTHPTAQVNFTRVVLEGGKLVEVHREVRVKRP